MLNSNDYAVVKQTSKGTILFYIDNENDESSPDINYNVIAKVWPDSGPVFSVSVAMGYSSIEPALETLNQMKEDDNAAEKFIQGLEEQLSTLLDDESYDESYDDDDEFFDEDDEDED